MSELPRDPDFEPDQRSAILLTVRPRRIAIYAAVGAVAVIVVMIIVAFKLRSSDTGVIFRTSDAVAMAILGLLFAGGLMLTARPRLRAYEEGLRVRNILGERFVSWQLIHRIAFPEGSQWAQLELADDELMPVMAIQAMDKARAVTALKAARDLHARYAPEPPVVNPIVQPAEVVGPPRPLGRLEQIDRAKAAQGKGKRRGAV